MLRIMFFTEKNIRMDCFNSKKICDTDGLGFAASFISSVCQFSII